MDFKKNDDKDQVDENLKANPFIRSDLDTIFQNDS